MGSVKKVLNGKKFSKALQWAKKHGSKISRDWVEVDLIEVCIMALVWRDSSEVWANEFVVMEKISGGRWGPLKVWSEFQKEEYEQYGVVEVIVNFVEVSF